MNFQIIKQAGIKQREFAALAGVTRVTVNHWMSGKQTPHKYIQMSVQSILDKIESAVDAGLLPTTRTNPQERMALLREAITPPPVQ